MLIEQMKRTDDDKLNKMRHEAAPELLQHFVGGVFRFAVDPFQQHFALRAGHVFQHRRIPVSYTHLDKGVGALVLLTDELVEIVDVHLKKRRILSSLS